MLRALVYASVHDIKLSHNHGKKGIPTIVDHYVNLKKKPLKYNVEINLISYKIDNTSCPDGLLLGHRKLTSSS